MKKSRGLMKQLLITVTALGVVAAFFVYHRQSNAAAAEQINMIKSSVMINSRLTQINDQRRANIDKVVAIISRYNRSMSDSMKYAIANEIYLMSQKYPNLNIDFIAATITHESAKTWDPTVVSRVGALGLMQIMPATGAFLAVEEGVPWTTAEQVLFDPITNIRLGCRYLNDMVALYEKDGGLAAYNGGPRRAEMWLAQNRNDQILWEETRNYIPAVLKLYDKFRSEGTM